MTWAVVLMAVLAQAEDGGVPGDAVPPTVDQRPVVPLRDLLRFDGNKVLPDDVYLYALRGLPPVTHAGVGLAHRVELSLTRFLQESGYELALVDAEVEDGLLMVHIDEGQLEKVVFRGRLNVQTVRFKLALELPHEIFNRSLLDKQIAALSKSLDLPDMTYQLVPTANVRHLGPQLKDLPSVAGIELIHERREMELQFLLPEHEWDTGLGADLRIGYVDGVEVGLNYQGRSGIFPDDRWRVEGAGGFGLRTRLDDGSLYAHFSRALVAGRYASPRFAKLLRLVTGARGELLSRQRADLNLEDYEAGIVAGSLGVEAELSEGRLLSAGLGLEWRRFFDFEVPAGETVAPGVLEVTQLRPFLLFRVDLTFDPQNNRWDRHHRLFAELRDYVPLGSKAAGRAALAYQYVKPLGWHDLWVRARAYAAWGDLTFHDEVSLGEFLRGGFGAQFVRRAASAGAEFRFSVARDLFKVALFTDLATYTEVNRETDTGSTHLAGVVGPGLNLLVGGVLQVDMYFAIGWRTPDAAATVAISALLQKAF